MRQNTFWQRAVAYRAIASRLKKQLDHYAIKRDMLFYMTALALVYASMANLMTKSVLQIDVANTLIPATTIFAENPQVNVPPKASATRSNNALSVDSVVDGRYALLSFTKRSPGTQTDNDGSTYGKRGLALINLSGHFNNTNHFNTLGHQPFAHVHSTARAEQDIFHDALFATGYPGSLTAADLKQPTAPLTLAFGLSVAGSSAPGLSFTEKQKKTFDIAAYDHVKEQFVVVIDPGHGGSDPGSIGHNGLQEKVITLAIAKRAKEILKEESDISVVMTRNEDKGLSRASRVERVKRSNADMVISLHLNHLPQAEINLVETYFASHDNIIESIKMQREKLAQNDVLKTDTLPMPDTRFTEGSRRLANIMQRRVYNEVALDHPDTDNAGVKQETLYILTRSFTPGVLIEMSCLSNHQEAERLTDEAYLDRLGRALADGIIDYRKAEHKNPHLDLGV